MKLKHFQSLLQDIECFSDNKKKIKHKYEQYSTPPEIAASMIFAISSNFNDINNKIIADLGCGTGILSVAAALLAEDKNKVIAIDIDSDALQVACDNIINYDCKNVELMLADVTNLPFNNNKIVDVVIMNPPFGTLKSSKNIDVKFLETACVLARHSVYSLHKSSTRNFILQKARSIKTVKNVEIIAVIKFELPNTYSFHKKEKVTIDVDFIRFELCS